MRKGKKVARPTGIRREARSELEIDALLDKIDEALLASDLKLMKKLTEQIPEEDPRLLDVLARRLGSGRSRAPGFALEILATVAGEQTPTYLRRIAEDHRAIDIVRFGAHRRLGWPQRGEKKSRRAFLETLKDAVGTLVEATDQGTSTWPVGIDVLEEVLAYLEAVASNVRLTTVRRAAVQLRLRSAWLLQAVLQIPDPKVQQACLEELVKLRATVATGAISRLARTTRIPAVRDAATAALDRLRLRPVGRGDEEQPLTLPPVDRVFMSLIDSDGGQVILVLREWEGGAFMIADIFHNDHWGIKGAFGSAQASEDQAEGIVDGLEDSGVYLVEADLAAARGALSAAVEVNRSTGKGIPPAFELWEILLHDTYPPPPGEAMVLPELDDTPYAGRDDLVRSSHKLADHSFFESWLFDPQTTFEAVQMAPPSRRGQLGERQYSPLIERLVGPEIAARMGPRLRRQAWLLDRTGDKKERDMALAVAARLTPGRPTDLARIPFLRALVQYSVDRVLNVADSPFGGDPL